MDAQLMGTAGFDAAFDERGAVQPRDRTVMGDGMLAAARCDDRHLLAVGRRAAERRVDGAVRGYRTPVRERQIAAVDAVRGELFGKAFVRLVVLGSDDQAAGVLVDAVDDARAGDAADARKLARAMVEQCVEDRKSTRLNSSH